MSLFGDPAPDPGLKEIGVLAGVRVFASQAVLWWVLGSFAVGGALYLAQPRQSVPAGIVASGFVILLVSALMHELGHVLAARVSHIAVERIELRGQSGAAVLATMPESPGVTAFIFAGGPAMTALLASGGALLCGWTPHDGWHAVQAAFASGSALQFLGAIAFVVNSALLVMNLLPGLPLDGGHLLRALLWRASGDPARAIVWPARLGMAIGLLACGLAIAVARNDAITGLLIGAIALPQVMGARTALTLARTITQLGDATVADALAPEQVMLDEDTSREEALGRFEHLGHMPTAHLPVITRDGRYLGLLRRSALLSAHPGATNIGTLVTPQASEPDVRLARPYEKLSGHILSGPLCSCGALAIIDSDERYRGLIYRSSVPRAIARMRAAAVSVGSGAAAP